MQPDATSDIVDTVLPAVVNIPTSTDETVPAATAESKPRQLYIRKADLDKHGYTAGCPRCDAYLEGRKTTVLHSDKCRVRMEAHVQADESEEQ